MFLTKCQYSDRHHFDIRPLALDPLLLHAFESCGVRALKRGLAVLVTLVQSTRRAPRRWDRGAHIDTSNRHRRYPQSLHRKDNRRRIPVTVNGETLTSAPQESKAPMLGTHSISLCLTRSVQVPLAILFSCFCHAGALLNLS